MNLELIILEILEGAAPRLLKRKVLFSQAALETDGLTESAFSQAITLLDRKKQIWIDAGEDVTRIKITPDGLARIAETR